MKQERITLAAVRELAKKLHAGQTDKGGKPYFFHVEAVALALAPFGEEAMMVGYLHDSIEDTTATLDDLRAHGVPEAVVQAVELMSRNLYSKKASYMDMIRHIASAGTQAITLDEIAAARFAVMGKIADNAHNSRTDRVMPDVDEDVKAGLAKRYARARKALYPATDRETITAILAIINTELLAEMG